MNLNTVIITLSLVLIFCSNVSYSKGGRGGGGGGRGGGRGGSRGSSSSKSSSKSSYRRSGGGYRGGGGGSSSSQDKPEHNYPGRGNYHHDGSKYGGTPEIGIPARLGTGFIGKPSSGMGGLGAGLAGAALGASVGAYGGYKLGKMVGGLGRDGHYGYYDDSYRYVRCDPPPKIEVDPETKITYIPNTITYDTRCQYYDMEPPGVHPYYNLVAPQSSSLRDYDLSGTLLTTCPAVVNIILLFISVLALIF